VCAAKLYYHSWSLTSTKLHLTCRRAFATKTRQILHTSRPLTVEDKISYTWKHEEYQVEERFGFLFEHGWKQRKYHSRTIWSIIKLNSPKLPHHFVSIRSSMCVLKGFLFYFLYCSFSTFSRSKTYFAFLDETEHNLYANSFYFPICSRVSTDLHYDESTTKDYSSNLHH